MSRPDAAAWREIDKVLGTTDANRASVHQEIRDAVREYQTARSVWPLLQRPIGSARFEAVYKAANELAGALAALTPIDLEYMRDEPWRHRRPPETFLDPVMDICIRAERAINRVPGDKGGPARQDLPFIVLIEQLLRLYEGNPPARKATAPRLLPLVEAVLALAGEDPALGSEGGLLKAVQRYLRIARAGGAKAALRLHTGLDGDPIVKIGGDEIMKLDGDK